MEGVGVGVRVGVGVCVGVGLGVDVGVTVGVAIGFNSGIAVDVGIRVAVVVGVGVFVGVIVGVPVGSAVGVGLVMVVGVGVSVGPAVGVGLGVFVHVGVGDGVGNASFEFAQPTTHKSNPINAITNALFIFPPCLLGWHSHGVYHMDKASERSSVFRISARLQLLTWQDARTCLPFAYLAVEPRQRDCPSLGSTAPTHSKGSA